jgi:plastocyanin
VKRLALVLALLFPASAAAESATVTMPGKTFSPARVTIVAGDSVLWRNGDLAAHDVKGGDFTSGPLASSSFFTHAFAAVGPQPFVCSIHPFMTGEVDVVAATLAGASAYAGERVTLPGRAPAGTPWVEVGGQSVVPAADGTFAVTVRPAATTVYVARTALGESPGATVTVTESIPLRVRLSGHMVRVTARSGLIATLQVYSRERFMWRSAGRVKLDRRGRGSIMHQGRLVGRARVAISRTAGGPVLATGDAFRLEDGHRSDVPHSHHEMG